MSQVRDDVEVCMLRRLAELGIRNREVRRKNRSSGFGIEER